MAEQKAKAIPESASEPEAGRPSKRPYREPAFEYERVFETMALACGKVAPTNFQCRFHRNSS